MLINYDAKKAEFVYSLIFMTINLKFRYSLISQNKLSVVKNHEFGFRNVEFQGIMFQPNSNLSQLVIYNVLIDNPETTSMVSVLC